ncbi:alpha/beta hydrolase [Novispirillum sp. DQ9]|uniref:alpha/beta hydrolase n=1 Tax=Novispirillum sp. DQ9 TaxID=3398612 RepID=UPI003C7A6CAE
MDHEAEYNARAAIPEHPAIFDDWAGRSAAARAKCADCLDVRYGDGPRETLDFFPAMTPDAPIVLYLHGGYWQSLDKSMFSFLGEALVHAGLSAAIVNTPQCPDARLPDIVAAARRAAGRVWTAAGQRLRGDRDRLFVAGHSAGAHLAASLFATDWPAFDPALPADLLKGGLGISGVYDLRPLVPTSINKALGLDEATARALSPMFAEPRTAGPLVLAVGGLESAEFHRQTNDFATAWAAKGVQVATMDQTRRNHLTILEDLADPHGPLIEVLTELASGRVSAART